MLRQACWCGWEVEERDDCAAVIDGSGSWLQSMSAECLLYEEKHKNNNNRDWKREGRVVENSAGSLFYTF